jgi:surface carbohydrate biosynthesis protein
MPLVGEYINLRVLVHSLITLRFGRWGYYRTFVELTEAQLILVWHDTNVESYLLREHISTPVACIQNGLRHDWAPDRGASLFDQLERYREQFPAIDRYFVFGEPTHLRFRRHLKTEYVSSGSFRLNEYSHTRVTSRTPRGAALQRVGFIVSFPNSSDIPSGSVAGNSAVFGSINKVPISYANWFATESLLGQALLAVCESRSLQLSIIGKRSERDPIEKDFFSTVPGMTGVEVLAHDKGFGYEACEPFDYLFTVDSTLGYEMLALGHKVGFVSNRFRIAGIDSDEMTFAHPLDVGKDGPIWTSATTTEGISEFIHRFLSLSDVEWQSIRTTLVPRLMALDPGNTKLRAYIDQVLAGSQ